MPLDTLAALIAFAVVATFTPGPNTMMLFASGVNFGFQQTIPHMLGITFGFAALLLAVGFGLGAAFEAYPPLQLALKIVGGTYLVYLAFRIATTRKLGGGTGASAKPLTFLQAALFQWVNPKAWMIGISAMAIYTNLQAPVASALIIVAVFAAVSFPGVSAWAGFGTALRGWLDDPARLRAFNLTMGALLLLSVYPIFAI